MDEDQEVAGAFLGKRKQQCPHPREVRRGDAYPASDNTAVIGETLALELQD